MLLQMLKSKLHCVTVTEANLNYMGSITIDEALMDAVGLLEGEMVHVVNNNNGERIVTYVIKGRRDSGVICLNGAAAHKFTPGDVAIIMAYATMTPEEAAVFKPKVVIPEKGTNRIV
ncbi:MAG: aspartate 1-decarboxylase [Bacteroidaceae bacterium]|nr:aspartate 1-decarboxylase [Bacteroidaceae bacterium]